MRGGSEKKYKTIREALQALPSDKRAVLQVKSKAGPKIVVTGISSDILGQFEGTALSILLDLPIAVRKFNTKGSARITATLDAKEMA